MAHSKLKELEHDGWMNKDDFIPYRNSLGGVSR